MPFYAKQSGDTVASITARNGITPSRWKISYDMGDPNQIPPRPTGAKIPFTDAFLATIPTGGLIFGPDTDVDDITTPAGKAAAAANKVAEQQAISTHEANGTLPADQAALFLQEGYSLQPSTVQAVNNAIKTGKIGPNSPNPVTAAHAATVAAIAAKNAGSAVQAGISTTTTQVMSAGMSKTEEIVIAAAASTTIFGAVWYFLLRKGGKRGKKR